MNLNLLQRPKRVRAGTNTLYIYAPSVLSEGLKLKPETIIKILEVHEGPTPEKTTLKVMEHRVWQTHTHNWYAGSDDFCTKVRMKRGDYEENERPVCGCEKPLTEMPEELRKATHFVLLSDIGR